MNAYMLTRSNTNLVTDARLARTQLEDAMKEKSAELESALAKQKAELEEKYGAEFDAAMEEGMWEDYKAQLQGIRDRAWELGWKAALRKVRVPGDDPAFRNPPQVSHFERCPPFHCRSIFNPQPLL